MVRTSSPRNSDPQVSTYDQHSLQLLIVFQLRVVAALHLHPTRSIPYLEHVPLLDHPAGSSHLCVQAVLGTAHSIHECTVSVDGGLAGDVIFAIFCQQGDDLPFNRAATTLLGEQTLIRGSVLAVRLGIRRNSFVSLSSKVSKTLATRAVIS